MAYKNGFLSIISIPKIVGCDTPNNIITNDAIEYVRKLWFFVLNITAKATPACAKLTAIIAGPRILSNPAASILSITNGNNE